MLRKSANGNSPEAFSLIKRYASRESNSCPDDVTTAINENRNTARICGDRQESRDFTRKTPPSTCQIRSKVSTSSCGSGMNPITGQISVLNEDLLRDHRVNSFCTVYHLCDVQISAHAGQHVSIFRA